MIILDTNVISETMKPQPAPSVLQFLDDLDPADVYVSAPTLAEIWFGVLRLPAGKRRDDLTRAVDGLFATQFDGRVVSFDATAAEAYGQLCARRQASGRPLPVIDGMIASICTTHSATLVTRNTSDFEDLGVTLINPW